LDGEGRVRAQFRGFQEDPGDASGIASLSPILGGDCDRVYPVAIINRELEESKVLESLSII
jgi:hypothetical protein